MTALEWKRNWLIENSEIPISEIYTLDHEEIELFYNLEQPVWCPAPAA